MSEWSPPDRSRSRAVLIGTSRYKELTQVPAAANSLESMYRLLTGPLCGWPAGRITRIEEPREPGNLPDRLVELFGQAGDVALFYYVGHGLVDFEDQLCLLLADSQAQSERLATTSLTFGAVRHALRASQAATKVVILDCCFAGRATRDRNTLAGAGEVDIAGLAGASGAYTLAATGPATTAWFESDADSPLPHTHFTRALIDTVTRGIPGAPAVLTLEPVYHRLREILPAAGKPAPTRVSRHNADAFVFARNVAPQPEPAPPPAVPGPSGSPAARRRLLDLAEKAARDITGIDRQCYALIGIASEAARDDADRARRLLEESERVTPTIKNPEDQARLWWHLASTTAASDPARARGYLAAFEQAITDPSIPRETRTDLLNSCAMGPRAVLGLDPDRTERLARAIPDESDRGFFIVRAVAAVAARDPSRAEQIARLVREDTEHYGQALRAVTYAIRDHEPDRAERIARAITHARSQCEALAEVAASVASYDVPRARGLLGEAKRTAERAGDEREVDYRLRDIIDGLIIDLGPERAMNQDPGADWILEQARRILRMITSEKLAAYGAFAVAKAIPDKPADVRELLEFAVKNHGYMDYRERLFSGILLDAAIVMLEVDTERAAAIAMSMEQLSNHRDIALLHVISAVAMTDASEAERLAYHVAGPGERARGFSLAAAAMAEENPDAAMTLLDHARRTGRAAGGKATAGVAGEIAALDPDLAVRILTEDGDASHLGDGLAEIAKVVMKSDPERAGEIALDIPEPSRRSSLLTQIAAAS